MSTIKYKLTKNNTSTAEQAPYTGIAIPVGSLTLNDVIDQMKSDKVFVNASTVEYIMTSIFEYVTQRIAEEPSRVSLGSIAIYPMISGSFTSEDADFDPTKNELYIGASFVQEVRDKVAAIVPEKETSDITAKVRIDSVMDLTTQQVKSINGNNPFRISGYNLAMPDGEDESLALYSVDGLSMVSPIQVNSSDTGQRLVCQLMPMVTIPKGKYVVRLASHGLNPTEDLTIVKYSVTLIAAATPPTPEVTSIVGDQTGSTEHLQPVIDTKWTATGTALGNVASVKMAVTLAAGGTKEYTLQLQGTASATQIVMVNHLSGGYEETGTWVQTGNAEFSFLNASGTKIAGFTKAYEVT